MASTDIQADQRRSESDVVLEVRDLSVIYDMERGRSRVVNEMSIDIEREEIIGIVGESGSGKSMFATALLDAVVEPGLVTGEVIYHPPDGEPYDVLDLSAKELKAYRWNEVSIVFQGALSSFNPVMKIGEHFVETIEAHHEDVGERMEHAYELMDELYLDPERVLDSYPHELSGGMKQRALIALSLILDPEVLVMDEPTAALDLLMQRSILELLEDLKEKYDLTLIFISHDLSLATELVDRLGVMYAFELAEIGPTDDLLDNASHPYTRALFNAVPNIEGTFEEMRPIAGASPDPVNIPSGCSYHPRCPLADRRCENENPELLTVDGEHRAACFYWDQVDDEIPLAHKQGED